MLLVFMAGFLLTLILEQVTHHIVGHGHHKHSHPKAVSTDEEVGLKGGEGGDADERGIQLSPVGQKGQHKTIDVIDVDESKDYLIKSIVMEISIAIHSIIIGKYEEK